MLFPASASMRRDARCGCGFCTSHAAWLMAFTNGRVASRRYLATTLTFSCIMAMSKDDLLKILQQSGYDAIQKAVFGRARWMRVKAALLEMCRTRRELLKHEGSEILFTWKDRKRHKLTITVCGEVLEQCLVGRHLTLLLELEELHNVLKPLRNMTQIRIEANSESLFRREVPVGEMDAKDITVLMTELLDRKLAPLRTEMQGLKDLLGGARAAKEAKAQAPAKKRPALPQRPPSQLRKK